MRYWEPCIFFEALVSIFSGMMLWLGFWDLLEMLLPPDAYTRLAMILIGIVGLFASRTMYDKSVLASIRSHEDRAERDDAAMLSSMEMACGGSVSSNSRSSSNGDDGGMSRICSDGSMCGHGDLRNGGSTVERGGYSSGGVGADSGGGGSSADGGGSGSGGGDSGICSSIATAAAARGHLAVREADSGSADDGTAGKLNAEGMTTRTPSAARARPARPARRVFDAPRPDARRCGRALFAILVGLTLWVGLWDMVDYHLIPSAFPGAQNATSICEAADADPGPRQLLRAPGCVALRLGIFAIGVGGLWVTRSLYGTVQVHAAQFSRFV